ncbi:uncharacterized protein LOC107044032 [Diachasma alloeum]|uniref:uncharacterized protein LOC107044032 n=1 Tax=Diachasma alloeum TaxID=454923 RepID=UPI0007383164|nr:uncharacterized protein LOC107044032 [Diachasma alloeum]
MTNSMKSGISPSSSHSTDNHQDNQLKRIGLKTFGGKPEQWKEFSDLFQSLVAQKISIPPVQKLVRLKECLKGPAAALISTFTATSENYEKAWQKLRRKYEDPRLVAQTLFNRILNLPKITKVTSEKLTANTAAASETLDQLQEVEGLSQENLVEQLIAHVLRQSLDEETLKQWELKLGDSKDFPSLQEFATFIESCARGISAGKSFHSSQELNAKKKKSSMKKSSYAAASQQPQEEKNPDRPLPRTCCACCNERHFISDCPKFNQMTPQKRNEFVVAHGLCFNCLGPHIKSRCTSKKTCHKCNGSHHTLIHGGSRYTSGSEPAQHTPVPSTSQLTALRPTTDVLPKEKNLSTSTAAVNINNQQISERAENNSQSAESDQQSVLLATAKVRVQSPKGFNIEARALIDQGSEISFISDQLACQLHLQRTSTTLESIGIGEINSGNTKEMVSVIIEALNGQNAVKIIAHILKKRQYCHHSPIMLPARPPPSRSSLLKAWTNRHNIRG